MEERTSVHGIGIVGSSGRLSLKPLLDALGWQAGDRLTWRPRNGLIIIGKDPGGRLYIRRDSALSFTSGARRDAGIRLQDRVLLTADTAHDCLIVFPQHVLDAMVIRQLTEHESDGAA